MASNIHLHQHLMGRALMAGGYTLKMGVPSPHIFHFNHCGLFRFAVQIILAALEEIKGLGRKTTKILPRNSLVSKITLTQYTRCQHHSVFVHVQFEVVTNQQHCVTNNGNGFSRL